MSDQDRRRLAKLINAAAKKARELIFEMRELQAFVSALNVATLRTWCALPNCPIMMAFDREGQTIRIGRTENARFPVLIPAHFEDELRDLDVQLTDELGEDS